MGKFGEVYDRLVTELAIAAPIVVPAVKAAGAAGARAAITRGVTALAGGVAATMNAKNAVKPTKTKTKTKTSTRVGSAELMPTKSKSLPAAGEPIIKSKFDECYDRISKKILTELQAAPVSPMSMLGGRVGTGAIKPSVTSTTTYTSPGPTAARSLPPAQAARTLSSPAAAAVALGGAALGAGGTAALVGGAKLGAAQQIRMGQVSNVGGLAGKPYGLTGTTTPTPTPTTPTSTPSQPDQQAGTLLPTPGTDTATTDVQAQTQTSPQSQGIGKAIGVATGLGLGLASQSQPQYGRITPQPRQTDQKLRDKSINMGLIPTSSKALPPDDEPIVQDKFYIK